MYVFLYRTRPTFDDYRVPIIHMYSSIYIQNLKYKHCARCITLLFDYAFYHCIMHRGYTVSLTQPFIK